MLKKNLEEENLEIKNKAYNLYEKHGFKNGNDFTDWLEAEKQSGKFVSGISLQGSSADKIQFIKKLVRSYHYTKNDTSKFSHCSNQD